MFDTDRIERHIDINASAERVWELIATPGWFINDGEIVENRIEPAGPDLNIVHSPVHGAFPLRTIKLDPPRYAAFRWLSAPDTGSAPSTLVEFWVEEAEGGVTLRVVESGFDTLSDSDEDRRRDIVEHTEGWEGELTAAQGYLDATTVRRAEHVNVPVAAVWSALTTDRFAQWYPVDRVEIDPIPGGEFRLRTQKGASYSGEVVTIEPKRTVRYRIAVGPDTELRSDNSTVVTFTLKPSGTGALVTVHQTGFTELARRHGEPVDNAASEAKAWGVNLAALRDHLSGNLTV